MQKLMIAAGAMAIMAFGANEAQAASVKIAFTIHSSPSNTFWQAVKKGFDDACGKVQADCPDDLHTDRRVCRTAGRQHAGGAGG